VAASFGKENGLQKETSQCSAHNHESLMLKHIRLLYLPANTTSYMQPLDQGMIYC
jgi:hypothetical protein